MENQGREKEWVHAFPGGNLDIPDRNHRCMGYAQDGDFDRRKRRGEGGAAVPGGNGSAGGQDAGRRDRKERSMR